MADNISDLEARQSMLDIAESYEKIAARAHIRSSIRNVTGERAGAKA